MGKEYTVEIDVEEAVCWGETLHRTESGPCRICMSEGSIYITGLLESVEKDGYAVLRLSSCIVPFEIAGDLPPAGIFVQLKTNKITLYEVT
ncbi:hypothetical protein QWJ34_26360 [Saccharibacillus sp. CPCC 101409]|uniref:hypothetical protein n=1 Tax=Saccharibacillus sp. CPCC 101409 TaxID=3058041 RepID=UPI0026725BDA|nr:hypothetical protein [Saccharibacillus sp. CPCC 101409]MDO3413303.1 hypothetical protein [Saccharibacillus sp. CPCC 101409]